MNRTDDKTPREILSKFYIDNHFDSDGGLKSRNVKIELGSWFRFYYPNFDARRKAVLRHDIHHLLTDYTTHIWGETEISAWEIGSGTKKYWAAFLLDTSGFMIGIPLNYFRVLKAFSRGRKTKNLYHDLIPIEQVLDMTVQDLRHQLNIDQHGMNSKPTLSDILMFSSLILYGTLYSIAALVLLPFIIVYSIYIGIKSRIAKIDYRQ